MSAPTGVAAPFEPNSAKRLLDQFVVSQATELALSGNYTSAESLLKELAQRPDASTEALDLMARICIQQGRVIDASGYWRRALEKEPGNIGCQAALARLNRIQRRPGWITLEKLFLRSSLRYRMEALGTIAFVALALGVFCVGSVWQSPGAHEE